MWQAIVFGFLGGVLGANGFPHFTRGITKRRYPCQLGNGPVPSWHGYLLFVMPRVKWGKPLAPSTPPRKPKTIACHMRATPLVSAGGRPLKRGQQDRID